MKMVLLVCTLVVLSLSCRQIQKATDVITNPTAREVYERNFYKEDSRYLAWKEAYTRARKDSLEIDLPYSEAGQFSSSHHSVYSYGLSLKEGEQLLVYIDPVSDSTEVFLDLFQKKDSLFSEKPVASSQPGEHFLLYEVNESARYLLVLQPEMDSDSQFQTKIYTNPQYYFPVAGAGNKNIQSFWGASRDGGRRSHKGVDIFAKRGTPVVAATEGRISFTGERGLGGKQVWLRDGIFGRSLYYAHLDSIAAENGQRVQIGDTLGFVGNTGNARTTAPHLHFGIYNGYRGAVDPLPFIKLKEVPETSLEYAGTSAKINRTKAELRNGPSTSYKQLLSLSNNDTVHVLGQTGNWFHIETKELQKGFIHQSLVKESL
ncbi:peptidoglycan DD-metalloendopeptidase family protein [Constantimarinum furrinae]|uniref:Metalloendopeptidase-like membrane protein n=1 Tax=Constantimarinum furrinae TaxID=2562285 RepID=A0A7G8PSI6_9FLAO|nr:peptidoglycan DD-metalloendopeptidase family protein [Constantimarinum furrinae]QNJ97302.1 Metalloendopeptidase-like membrane protein [Constantimarinum furrinae]